MHVVAITAAACERVIIYRYTHIYIPLAKRSLKLFVITRVARTRSRKRIAVLVHRHVSREVTAKNSPATVTRGVLAPLRQSQLVQKYMF